MRRPGPSGSPRTNWRTSGSADSISSRGTAVQFTAMNGPPARGDSRQRRKNEKKESNEARPAAHGKPPRETQHARAYANPTPPAKDLLKRPGPVPAVTAGHERPWRPTPVPAENVGIHARR